MADWRKGEFGKRPVRVANCSGYCGDPADEMYKQATLGDVDFITGDYLAEVNIAKNAEAFAAGKHPGYEETAWQGLAMSIDTIAAKGIKVAINGGALNPKGLAEKVAALAASKKLALRVAFISGDDLVSQVGHTMPTTREATLPHLDTATHTVTPIDAAYAFLPKTNSSSAKNDSSSTKNDSSPAKNDSSPAKNDSPSAKNDSSSAKNDSSPAEIVSANAYMGARGIVAALREGADIVIAGRVSDASPVIAAAWYWWNWQDTAYDALAGALVAGHLIECSAYVTGGNFAGFTLEQYGGWEHFADMAFPIAEIAQDGTCVVTKHEGMGGVVDVNTVRCQLVYELQGNVYLHSDSKAFLDGVQVEQVGKDRVHVHGIKGAPPPPTTKLAIFYKGGFESEILVNATGYAFAEKFKLIEKQIRDRLAPGALEQLDVLEFQHIGVPAQNPTNQNSSTVYLRILTQAKTIEALMEVKKAMGKISLKQFSGLHFSSMALACPPQPYLAYYPALWKQDSLNEAANMISSTGAITSTHPAGHPPAYEALAPRDTYDTKSPISLSSETKSMRLGDIALARSGDKGSNLNVGVFVQTKKQWDWLRTWLSRDTMWKLLGEDAQADFSLERVEFPHVYAVHFVIYGILGRGVSSSTRLDSFGKGFADYLRDKVVQVPVDILE